MAEIIAISTNKGGVLKTSLTTNIAGVLAKQDKKVLIIDMDNQSNVSLDFGIEPDNYDLSIYNVFIDNYSLDDVIYNPYENIDVALSNDNLTMLEYEVFTNLNKYEHFFNFLNKELTDSFQSQYDYILIDTPPNLGLATSNALYVADEIIIPFQPETYAVRSLMKTVQFFNDFRDNQNPDLTIKAIVPTLVNSQTNLHSSLLQECRQFGIQSDLYVTDTVIPKTIRFADSVANKSLPATLLFKENHKLIHFYYELVNELKL